MTTSECVPSIAMRLSEVHTSASGAISRISNAPVGSIDCRWRIEALKQGTYQVDLLGPGGSAGSSDVFALRDQVVTRVMIGPAAAYVSGGVTVAGKPAGSASVEFVPRNRQWGPITTTTDPTGRYSVAVARPGQYDLLLQGTSAPTVSRSVDVAVGRNTIDWVISALGKITVRVRGLQPQLPATVHVESRQTSHHGDIARGATPILTKEGLEFGDYSVSAVQGDTLVSAIENVRLDAAHPEITIEVEVGENRAQLIVSDFKGNAVLNTRLRSVAPAQIFARGSLPIQSTQAGVYPLSGLRPGTYLLIRADGLVPACVTVPRNGTVYATLEAGRRVEVQMPRDLTPAVVRELAALTDVPGSDCPVPLAEFSAIPKGLCRSWPARDL